MKRKCRADKIKLLKKTALLIGSIILLGGLLLLRQQQKEEYVLKKNEKETAGEMETEINQETKTEKVSICNLKEYAGEVMGDNAVLLEQRLGKWKKENKLEVTEGIIFQVLIPDSDTQSINFYLSLNDVKESIVLLSYHPRENIVTASNCQYTKEEILNEIWEDNGPMKRDVPDSGTEEQKEQEEQEEQDDIK